MKRFALLWLLIAVPAGAAVLNITDDTYVDNLTVGPATNIYTNYGGNPAVKSVSNNGLTGSNPTGVSSITHALFKLPTAFWGANGVGASPVTSPVTITYNIRNNSLTSKDTGNATVAANNNFRQLELHPLQQAFTAGTGGAGSTDTSAGAVNGTVVNGTPTYYGADWATADGITPWAGGAVGGKFDASFTVMTTPLIKASTQKVATWDITALLNDATARAEIQNFGLYVAVTDEAVYTGNEFASMVSYDSGQAAGTYFGLGPTVTFVPEPATLTALGAVTTLILRRRRTA